MNRKQKIITAIPLSIIGLSFIACASQPKDSTFATNPPTSIGGSYVETTTTEPAGPAETAGQKNARLKAKSYLEFSSFSRSGLLRQLAFEGFSEEDAEYGVQILNVDWNEQAAKKAKSYLEHMPFSHAGLIQQLTSGEGFTPAQAEHGVKAAGL